MSTEWQTDAEAWIRSHVEPTGPTVTTHEEPWSTVLRVPIAGGAAWFKACAPVQAFEPRLTAELSARWPDRVSEVLAFDEERSWLLLADAGTPIRDLGNAPELWLAVLPGYAELQRGEIPHTPEHLAAAVPDRRVAGLPGLFAALLGDDLPLEPREVGQLRAAEARFSDLCRELASHGVRDTVQHDDLHGANVYRKDSHLRLLDWGDACISHPFASMVVTFRFLDEVNRLPPEDRWYTRLRDAYLEPWGPALVDVFEIAMRVGWVSHTFGWSRQRQALSGAAVAEFDNGFATILRRALAQIR